MQEKRRRYAELSGVYQSDKSEGDQLINLFEQPERLGERVALSMSLIDQEHTGTWGEGGLIVEVPIENIVLTSPTDAGAVNFSKEFLKIQAHKHPPLSADELLQSTSPCTYNEVVVFGKSESGKTLRLAGFFIKVNKHGQPINPVIAEKMRQHARRLNLPLVKIQVQELVEQEPFEIGKNKNEIWANYKGKRYNLGSDNPELAFNAYDFRGEQFFPSSEEIEEVIAHLKQQGYINEALAQQIRERYKIADFRRKSPKIEYDPKSREITRVTIRDGYGKGEIEYVLDSSGYCCIVHIKEYNNALREAFLGVQQTTESSLVDEFLRYLTPLSSYDALLILERRKEMMNPEEYQRVVAFFKSIRDKIDQTDNQLRSRSRRFGKLLIETFKK